MSELHSVPESAAHDSDVRAAVFAKFPHLDAREAFKSVNLANVLAKAIANAWQDGVHIREGATLEEVMAAVGWRKQDAITTAVRQFVSVHVMRSLSTLGLTITTRPLT